MLHDPRIRSKSVHPWAFAENFPGGGVLRFFSSLHMPFF